MAGIPDLSAISNMYPSPDGSERESDSPQPSQADDGKAGTAAASKPAAKRKRENRYKNAPPSVLSVSFPTSPPQAISAHPMGAQFALAWTVRAFIF
jgi:hypothetical protein